MNEELTKSLYFTLQKAPGGGLLLSPFHQPGLDLAHPMSLPILLANTWSDCRICLQRGLVEQSSPDVCLGQRRHGFNVDNNQSVSVACFL